MLTESTTTKIKFEELGLKVPETWDEFEQLVKDIVAKGQTPFGIAGAEAWTLNGYNQLAFATAAGGGKEANQYLVILSQIPLNCLIRL